LKVTLPSAKCHSQANRILAALPGKDLLRLVSDCEKVPLVLAEELLTPGEKICHVHFPIQGFVSLLTPVDNSAHLEVGLVGDEGMVGTPLVLGIPTSPLQAVVQGAGYALRMDAARFREALGRSKSLRLLLDRYLFVRMTQLAQATGCTRFHLLDSRLARWLLMTQDRAHANTLHITHELLAAMLGVRRAGVTRAATSLQDRGLIRYRRGEVEVLDRPGLRAAACTCYEADRRTYRSVLDDDAGQRKSAGETLPRPK
jgi:CRP-like cAMP-binding protein